MKISEQLRAGARYMREHGFSPHYSYGDCGCFMRAIDVAVRSDWCGMKTLLHYLKTTTLPGPHAFTVDRLRREGWNTDDAVAAMEIAADCAESEGK